MSEIITGRETINNILQIKYQDVIKEYEKEITHILGDDTLIELGIRILGGEEKFAGWLCTDNIFFEGKPLKTSVQKIIDALRDIDYSHLL